MRHKLTKDKLLKFMSELGSSVKSEGSCFFTGGATAVMHGWRETTIDVDLKLDPEPIGVFESIAKLKETLNINVELASPDQFIPVADDWRTGSAFIGKFGKISFYHYDYVSQALSKLERGHEQDLRDVKLMLQHRMITKEALRIGFQGVRAKLVRYPAIDADQFEKKVEEFLKLV